ncbi:MAG TPA: alpha/beta fold hydrolase, partial [Rhizomicrobium sp.]|nr:alpha/beta fold hydrolase [Rhizomicrobium sp.]
MRIRHLILPIMMSLSAAPASAGLPLTSCHVPYVKEAVLCGTFRVPENRSLSGGRQIPLQVVVLPARKKPAKEPVFFFAGGPGQPATETAPGFADSWIREEHDVVLLDQRGTGKGNRLDCLVGGSEANPQDYIEPLFFHGTRYDTCVKALSKNADLTQYTTAASMRDADDLRQALGYDKIDVYGGSYGTRAGIVYLRMFSKNVRLAVLSGIDPISDRGPLNHASAAQQAFDTLAEQCAADASCHQAFDP